MKPTKLLYLTDSYQKRATATIINITEDGAKKHVILDQTIFYPQGGGQPSDKGIIKSSTGTLEVTSVRYADGIVLHRGHLEGRVDVGQTVELELDWNTRYHHMQLHTAGHLLDEAVKELFPEHHGIDGQHGIDRHQYVDFNGFIDASSKDQLLSWIQDRIRANEPISAELVSKKEIEDRKIFLPFKLPSNKPLRMVSFGSRQPVPDGGTQLKTTAEAWPIDITEFEYLTGSTRIHYQVTSPSIPATSSASQLETDSPQKPSPTVAAAPMVTLESFQQELDALKQHATQAATNPHFEQEYLGKKGKFNELAKRIKNIEPHNRGEAGKRLNQLKEYLNNLVASSSRRHVAETDWFDISIPGIPPQTGHTHLITQAIEEISAIFQNLGFVRRRYPEIETDWYYAEGLNIPKDHPARDDQETFYIDDNVVLTAHTSNGQLREMELLQTPPIKMINIGKTYRRQASNTHSPMFHQFEGLLIDKGITMTHLVGVSNYFAKHYFGPDREIRLRPHHFQFTEPSFEVDINCHICKGTGIVDGQKCKVCKSGWLELGGAGMVHPNVLRNGGINPEEYSGFAFGWGVERVIMMKHQVTDNLRQLYTADLRFLQQS